MARISCSRGHRGPAESTLERFVLQRHVDRTASLSHRQSAQTFCPHLPWAAELHAPLDQVLTHRSDNLPRIEAYLCEPLTRSLELEWMVRTVGHVSHTPSRGTRCSAEAGLRSTMMKSLMSKLTAAW